MGIALVEAIDTVRLVLFSGKKTDTLMRMPTRSRTWYASSAKTHRYSLHTYGFVGLGGQAAQSGCVLYFPHIFLFAHIYTLATAKSNVVNQNSATAANPPQLATMQFLLQAGEFVSDATQIWSTE